MKDPLKAKHLKKALESLAEEGVTQLFRPSIGSDFIVGAVGQLQFEVMADRLREEYQLDVIFEASPYGEARWILGDKAVLEDFMSKHRGAMGNDIDEQPVFLAKSSWDVGYAVDRHTQTVSSRFSRSERPGPTSDDLSRKGAVSGPCASWTLGAYGSRSLACGQNRDDTPWGFAGALQ